MTITTTTKPRSQDDCKPEQRKGETTAGAEAGKWKRGKSAESIKPTCIAHRKQWTMQPAHTEMTGSKIKKEGKKKVDRRGADERPIRLGFSGYTCGENAFSPPL